MCVGNMMHILAIAYWTEIQCDSPGLALDRSGSMANTSLNTEHDRSGLTSWYGF